MSEHDIPSVGGADYLSNLIQAISSAAANDPPSNGTSESPPTIAQATNGGDLISSLLSSPDVLSKLPSVISAIKPVMEIMGAQIPSPTLASPPQIRTAEEPRASNPQREHGDSRTALLCAMKPYLSAERRQAIDYIVKLGRLGDILKTL